MKVYNNSVKLNYLKIDLDSNHNNTKLDNNKLIDRRWKKTEKALKEASLLIQRTYYQLSYKNIFLLKQIGFNYASLNKSVPNYVKRYVNDKIESWKQKGLVSGYLKYLISVHTWEYKSVLYLLLYGLYAEQFSKIKEISEDVFIVSAVDIYSQSIAERQKEDFKLLDLSTILALAIMPVIQNTYSEYLDGIMIEQADEMQSFILTSLIQNVEISEDAINILLQKQAKRIINVNKKRYSGGLDDASRAVGNSAYLYNTEDDKELQVRFVAEIDNRTTKMCESLNNQVFYVNKENTFKRYSELHKGIVEVKCFGLVAGLNMPPITDHFHWCRSTLTYQI